MYSQIQNIPTPILFLKRGTGDLEDFVSPAMYHLDAFVAVTGQPVAAAEAVESVSYGLQSMLVNGKQPIAPAENFPPFGVYSLQSFIAVVADQFSQSDSANGNYALQSFVAVTAQQRPETDEANASYALQSMVV